MINANNNHFTNKKTIVQFVLSLFVFFIHFRAISVFSANGPFLTFLSDALLTLTHVAVPLFFLISGVLFYRNYTPDLRAKKWKSRFYSLIIPYLSWNTIWFILALLGQYTPLGAFLGGIKTTFSWNALFRGIFLYEFFEPFWFILQLIVLTTLCPVIFFLLKEKKRGLITISVFFLSYCFGLRINFVLLPNPPMVIFYLLGAWIGLHYFNVFASRRTKDQASKAFIVFLLCCIFNGTKHLLPGWCIHFQLPLLITIVSCLAFWTAFDYFDMKKYPDYMKECFLIYAMHSLIGAALSKIIYLLLPDGQVSLFLTAVIAFPITVGIICTFGKLLGQYFPGIKRILAGRS